jgi:hypothetical protein
VLIFYLYSWEAIDESLPHKYVETNQQVTKHNWYSLEYQSFVELWYSRFDLEIDYIVYLVIKFAHPKIYVFMSFVFAYIYWRSARLKYMSNTAGFL